MFLSEGWISLSNDDNNVKAFVPSADLSAPTLPRTYTHSKISSNINSFVNISLGILIIKSKEVIRCISVLTFFGTTPNMKIEE